MAHGIVSEIIPATSAAVFAVLHDYGRRLEWDTLLSAAYLHEGFSAADRGAISTCIGRAALGKVALTTKYVSFSPGRLAAVKMTRGPWLFERWAASIKHADLGDGRSRITYAWQFTAWPRVLRWLIEPLVNAIFCWETRKRLAALRKFMATAGWYSPAVAAERR
ncbi:SRPBCC family protein [Anatilimnocola floriformis]|uniref:SRPBCC family protein n=1 Tax=Anatilimnocola floriformis TaxID=2948575 RepID=UPI0020C207A4|nr:SRPBCC family protein [Anatilimnocola floriformis]